MNQLSQPQRQFLSDLDRLASMLHDRDPNGTSPTLRTLLKEILRGAAMIRGGYLPKTCHEFAMRRMTWRVQYDLVDDSTFDEAMRLLADIIPAGIELLWPVDWRVDTALISMVRAQTGFDLAV